MHYAANRRTDRATFDDLETILEVFYADDLSFATQTAVKRENIKTDVPQKLESYNLHVNLGKTEEGEAPDRRPRLLLLPLQTKTQATGLIGPL